MNTKLEEWIISLEKNRAKLEQYSWCNNTELSGIPNDIPEKNLEKVLIDICHDSSLEIEPKDIEGCHCLPVSRNSGDSNKGVIVKSVNRKHLEPLLWNKKSISGKDFSHLNAHVKVFVSVSLCPYYQYIWGKSKDLQRRGKIYQFIKVTQCSSAMKIFHESDILDLDTGDVVWKRLCLILFCKYRSVLISVLKSIFVIEYFMLLTPFLFTTFPTFYHSTSLLHDACIKSKDGHQISINCVNDVVARKVST